MALERGPDNVLRLGYWQAQIHRSPARYKVGVAGRRFGKTTLAVVRSLAKAVNIPKAKVYYIAPTYRMAKDLLWEPLKALIPKHYRARGSWKNETELRVTLRNGSTIHLKGADNPDSLRGPGLDHATFDEYADMDPRTWPEVIRPALADKQGTADWWGTPKGFNHFYELWLQGQPEYRDKYPEWESWTLTTLRGGRVPHEEILKALAELDIRVFRQEFLASFETMAGRVYDNFVRGKYPNGNLDAHILDLGQELYIGMDFNINPMSAVVLQKRKGLPEVLASIQLMTSNTDAMAKELRRRYPDRKLIVCPDASGNSGHSNAPVGQTDFTILQSYKMEIRTGKVNPPPTDRINNVQSNLLTGSGLRRLRIRPECKELIKGLEGLVWKKDVHRQDTTQVDKSVGLDHICDALGYVLWQEFNQLSHLLPRVAPVLSGIISPYDA